jgi:inosose dehydratase
LSGIASRLAGAPITWGICEVPGWGHQMDNTRVLSEAAAVGLRAMELGPPGFLGADAREAAAALELHGLRLAAGFVALVLHDDERARATLDEIARSADVLAGAGADVLVLAAQTGRDGYDVSADLDARGWSVLADTLQRADCIARERGLELTVHPHYGTMIETAAHVERFLAETDASLCLDTGHLLVGGADPLEVARRASGRVRHVHLKDVDGRMAARVRARTLTYHDAVAAGMYCVLGEGDARVLELIPELERSGYDGWYVLEQDTVLAQEPRAGAGPAADAGRSLERVLEIAA